MKSNPILGSSVGVVDAEEDEVEDEEVLLFLVVLESGVHVVTRYFLLEGWAGAGT